MADDRGDPAPAMPARMTEPFEAGVVVRDLELMARFYREALGCSEVHRSRIPASIGVPAGLGDELLVVWLQVPSGGRVKLIRPQVAPAPAYSVLPLTARRGLSYLTFHLDDMDPVVTALVTGEPGRCRIRSSCGRAVAGSASGRIRRATRWSWSTGAGTFGSRVGPSRSN